MSRAVANGHGARDTPAVEEGAVAHDPCNPVPLYLTAIACRRRGDIDGWRTAVDSAFQRHHSSPEQRYYRAFAKLRMGDWSGWGDYEARHLAPHVKSQDIDFAREVRWTHGQWDGVESLVDKTLLVLNEQGIGDAIQMLRFIPTLAARVGKVVASVTPRLIPLVDFNFGSLIDIRVDGMAQPITYDRYAWNMSLPALIGYLPCFVPLRAPRRRVPLATRQRPIRAGVCWAGNPLLDGDSDRSIPIDALSPLFARSDVEWYSLQVGERASEGASCPGLITPSPELTSFADTADVIVELDYVVTVDTAVCHLAGSLGVPVLLLLSVAAEWRWGEEDRTPWYPSMCLIRLRTPGDWRDVIDSVDRTLTH